MIQVYFTDAGGELRVDMLGHGDLGNMEGLDVMCAAATTLANTLAISVMTMDEGGCLEEEATIYIGDDAEGKARILCKPKPQCYSVLKTVYATVVNGFIMLSRIYPEHVELVTE